MEGAVVTASEAHATIGGILGGAESDGAGAHLQRGAFAQRVAQREAQTLISGCENVRGPGQGSLAVPQTLPGRPCDSSRLGAGRKVGVRQSSGRSGCQVK